MTLLLTDTSMSSSVAALEPQEGCTEYAINEAARNGHLGVLVWFHANRCQGVVHFEDVMDAIAASGHLHVLKWFHDNTSESYSPDAMMRAAAGGHLDVVRYLHENQPHESSNLRGAVWMAARHGHLGIAEWLYRNRSGGRVGLALRDTAESLEQRSSASGSSRSQFDGATALSLSFREDAFVFPPSIRMGGIAGLVLSATLLL